jgi:short subunit dehydrogenase-like uncharacterized protein
MTGRVLLYGASGFSGRRIAGRLADLGRSVVLAGRDAAKVGPISEELRLPMRSFGLMEGDAIDSALGDVSLVLNAAGPYRDTASPMIAACLRTGTDYADLSGEWPSFAAAMAQDETARAAGVMLLPGAGVAITVTDCLLAMAADSMPAAAKLRLAISSPHPLSRGSIRTALSLTDSHVLVRRAGVLHRLPGGRLARDFDFGDGLRRAVSFSWPDVVTGQFTTGVPTIEAYCESNWLSRAAYRMVAAASSLAPADAIQATAERVADAWPAAPPPESLENAGYCIVAQAEDRWRRTSTLRLRIADGYSTTTETANAIVRRVLGGDRRPGFQTPGRLFGGRFVLKFADAVAEPAPA